MIVEFKYPTNNVEMSMPADKGKGKVVPMLLF
jgi:hypothetical protein